MEIHSTAVFNAASVEEEYFAQAKTVRFTMELWKKTDTVDNDGQVTAAKYVQIGTGQYVDKKITDYLLGVSVQNNQPPASNNNHLQLNTTKSNDFTYVYDVPIEDCFTLGPRIYPAYVTFYAITGKDFTEYANYKVMMYAELLNANGDTIGNQPNDFIVYTNAKVYPTVIDESNTFGSTEP